MGPSRGVNSMKKRFTWNDHHCNTEKKKYWMVIKKYRKAYESQDTPKGLPAERTMLWFFLCSDHQSNKKWDKKKPTKIGTKKPTGVSIFNDSDHFNNISKVHIWRVLEKNIQSFSRDVETYRETGNNTNQQTDTFYCDLGL